MYIRLVKVIRVVLKMHHSSWRWSPKARLEMETIDGKTVCVHPSAIPAVVSTHAGAQKNGEKKNALGRDMQNEQKEQHPPTPTRPAIK